VFTSVDISAPSLQQAQEMIKSENIGNVTLCHENIEKLSFADATFDHIFVCFVLEHLEEPMIALHELKRVLKTGGTISVIEGDHGSCFWHPPSREGHWAWQAFITAQSEIGHDGLIGRRLYPLLTQAGYRVEDVSPRWIYADQSHPQLLDGIVNKIIVAMLYSSQEQVLHAALIKPALWQKGLNDISAVAAHPQGTFFYTWFKGTAHK
jgi:SAM-dependent methyltransferase